MKDKILVFGSSGHACVIIELLEKLDYEILGCVDSFQPKGKKVLNYEVLGDEFILSDISKFQTNKICIAVGNNSNRKMVYEKLISINPQITFPNIISQTANISKTVIFGIGNVIMDNVILHSNAKLGDFNLLNTSSIIEHDCQLENFVSISPNATLCGNVKVGNCSFIGASSVVIQRTNISKSVVIGAGSVVITDCPEQSLLVGNPAKIIKENYIKKNYL